MRSLMLGDVDHYKSPYMRGVAQAMKLLGHEHAEVSIRDSARAIEQRIKLWAPAIIWTHMLLWPPPGSPKVADLMAVVSVAAKRGALVVIHDGDARAACRHPSGISDWCSLALVNHAYDRTAWRVPTMRWPYFAQVQEAIAPAVEALRCGLFFAGTVGAGLYAGRSALLSGIRERGVDLRMPPAGVNTIDQTAEIAASSDAVLGFGRPEIPSWVDTRCFSYPGAGGILLHDDVQGYLDPWKHFVPYKSGDASSVAESLLKLRAMPEVERRTIRVQAFAFVQEHHSSVARVKQVLHHLELS